jgi:arabinofuranan 3-O-arabinosyltransferase
MQSLLGVVRWLGGGMAAAWLAQGLLIVAVLAGNIWLWRQKVRYEIKAAALSAGALLATPYLYVYDFPVLAIPLAFLMRMGLREGFLPWELAGIALACALILAFPVLAMPTGFAAAIVASVLIARRALLAQRSMIRGDLLASPSP